MHFKRKPQTGSESALCQFLLALKGSMQGDLFLENSVNNRGRAEDVFDTLPQFSWHFKDPMGTLKSLLKDTLQNQEKKFSNKNEAMSFMMMVL